MNDPVEQNAIENLVTRLTERFPSVDAERIRLIVDEEAARLESNPVRQYVPSLIEHAADERLREEAEPVAVGEGGAGGPVLVTDDELDPLERERREREQNAGFMFGDLGGGPV